MSGTFNFIDGEGDPVTYQALEEPMYRVTWSHPFMGVWTKIYRTLGHARAAQTNHSKEYGRWRTVPIKLERGTVVWEDVSLDKLT